MEHIIKIEKINHQGDGIGRINDKVIFVSKTIPNDVVKVKILKEHKNYYEGKVISYLERDKDVINYQCPYYNECGGCHIANLTYSKQLEYKTDKVKNILKKYNDLDLDIKIISSKKELHYRNKVTFHVNKNLGYYKENTNELIKIEQCLLLSNNINKIINRIDELDLSKVTEVIIREINNKIMVIFKGEIELIKQIEDVDIIYVNDNKIYGNNDLEEIINDYHFIVSPESFFQVNLDVTNKLYDKIKEYCHNLENSKVLDLYCGTGTIGISISKNVKEVIGIEINEEAVKNADENKRINRVNNISFINGKVEEVLTTDKVDTIIVDPPRSGLDKITKNKILEINPKMIIYVSCDPMTLARDINDLKDKYKVKEITLFDMFPQTYHVESLMLLEEKNIVLNRKEK